MSMKIRPVVVKIEDDKHFAQVVLLIDQLSFLIDIEKARELLGIKPQQRSTVLTQLQKEQEVKRRQFIKDLKQTWSTPPPPEIFKQNPDGSYKLDYVYPQKTDPVISKLIAKYGKTYNFINVIKMAILCNEVTEDDYLPPYRKPGIGVYGYDVSTTFIAFPSGSLDDPNYETDQLSLNPWEAAIVINPLSTQKEVAQVFSSYKRSHKKPGGYWKLPDTFSNIKRDRNWYWLHELGKSYNEVFEIAKNDGETLTFDGVRKAIAQYKKLVSSRDTSV